MPLQGVWTADAGSLPPWHGDYHHDLNTQLTYWAYLASNRFDHGLSFLDFMWSLKPVHEEFARFFLGLKVLLFLVYCQLTASRWDMVSVFPVTNNGSMDRPVVLLALALYHG
jgi:hypothetical protein